MEWIFIGMAFGLSMYMLGYVVRGFVDQEKFKETRGQMDLDECYGCKEAGLPCDPKCKYNVMNTGKELKVKDGEPEKNDSEKD